MQRILVDHYRPVLGVMAGTGGTHPHAFGARALHAPMREDALLGVGIRAFSLDVDRAPIDAMRVFELLICGKSFLLTGNRTEFSSALFA